MKKSIILIFLLGLLSCDKQFKITPIYESFNNEAEYNIKYFNISGYENISYDVLLDSIIQFSENELKLKFRIFTKKPYIAPVKIMKI